MRALSSTAMVTVAGYVAAACGVGHSVGALVLTVPTYGGTWFRGALWAVPNDEPVGMPDAGAAFWFSVQSFGVPLLLVGLLLVWAGRRALIPPVALAWALATWTVVGVAFAGPSPLLFLLVAVVLLLLAHRRNGTPEPAAESAAPSGVSDESGSGSRDRRDRPVRVATPPARSTPGDHGPVDGSTCADVGVMPPRHRA